MRLLCLLKFSVQSHNKSQTAPGMGTGGMASVMMMRADALLVPRAAVTHASPSGPIEVIVMSAAVSPGGTMTVAGATISPMVDTETDSPPGSAGSFIVTINSPEPAGSRYKGFGANFVIIAASADEVIKTAATIIPLPTTDTKQTKLQIDETNPLRQAMLHLI